MITVPFVLASFLPKWCQLILSGEKTVEVRKTRPRSDTPFDVYIYCTEPHTKDPKRLLEIHSQGKIHRANGFVVGKFTCDRILSYAVVGTSRSNMRYCEVGPDNKVLPLSLNETCLSYEEFSEYGKGKKLYGWHIKDVEIFDEPRPLSSFCSCTSCVYGGACNKECWNTFKRPPQSWNYAWEVRKICG